MASHTMRPSLLGLHQALPRRNLFAFTAPSKNLFAPSATFSTTCVRPIQQRKKRSHRQQHDLTTSTAAHITSSGTSLIKDTTESDIRPFNTAAEDAINAPASTLPPALDNPTQKPDEAKAMFWLRKGLAYGRFYKTGIKNAAWTNVKLAEPVLRRYKQDGGLDTAMDSNWLTRSDFQLIRRRTYDFRRIPIIALIFAIAGEWTPFVVIGISGVVPYTCRVPHQIEGDRKKLEKRRKTSFDLFLPQTSIGKKAREVNELTWSELLHCSASIGLHSSIWPSTLLPIPPSYILAKRLDKHVKYLEVDDMLLIRDDGVEKINNEELALALITRGLNTVDVDTETQRASLQYWLKQRYDHQKSCYELWMTPQPEKHSV